MHVRLALLAFAGLCVTKTSAFAQMSTCPGKEAEDFKGLYDLTTMVLGGHRETSKGVNGYYILKLDAKQCELRVGLYKLGYEDKRFKLEQVQKGMSAAKLYHVNGDKVVLADLDVKGPSGDSLSMAFHFVFRAPLGLGSTRPTPYGMWRYLGQSWDTSGMWGGLKLTPRLKEDAPFNYARFKGCKADFASNKAGKQLATVITCGAKSGQGSVMVATPGLEELMYEYSESPSMGFEGSLFSNLYTRAFADTQAQVVIQTRGTGANSTQKRTAILQTNGESTLLMEERHENTSDERPFLIPERAPEATTPRWGGSVR